MLEQRIMCVNLTLQDLQVLIKQSVEDALDKRIRQGTPPTETRGIDNCAKKLNTYPKIISGLVKNHTLGFAIWKNDTGRGNSPVFMNNEIAKRRYQYYISATKEVRQAFEGQSPEDIEKMWQSINL